MTDRVSPGGLGSAPKDNMNQIRYVGQLILLFAVYFVMAKLGLMLDAVSGFATLVWAPSGIALASIYLFGFRMAPAVAAAAFLVNFSSGAAPIAALGIATGNTLEAVIGAFLLRKRGFRPSLSRGQDVVSLVIFGALLSPIVSATWGVFSLWQQGVIASPNVRTTWQAWWIGDALGILVVAPVLMVFRKWEMRRSDLSLKRLVEAISFGVGLTVIGAIFFEKPPAQFTYLVSVPYVVFFLVIWSSVRFGVRGTTATTLVLAVISVIATAIHVGPFASQSLREGLSLLDIFVGAVAVMALTLSAAVAERITVERQAKELEERNFSAERFRSVLHMANDAFISMDSNGLITYWNPQAQATFGWLSSEVIGKPLAETIIPAQFRQAHLTGVRRFLITNEGPILNRRIEMIALHKDGHEIPVELTVSPIQSAGTFFFGAFLHNISARKQNELFRTIQLSVTRILVESQSVEDAAKRVLEAIANGLKWQFGAVWVRNSRTEPLKLVECWRESELQAAFESETRKLDAIPLGTGLPSQVSDSGKPALIIDVTKDNSFVRSRGAATANIRGAFAFPLTLKGEVAGVMEFFSEQPGVAGENLLEAVADIGVRFGMFIQRNNAEKNLRTLHQTLEQRVEERTRDLFKTESELRLITDMLPMAVTYLDQNMKFLFVNETYAKWRGIPKSDIVGKSLEEISGPETMGAALPFIQNVMSGQSDNYELDVQYADRKRRVLVNSIPDVDSNGNIRGIISVTADITDQKFAADELRRAKEAAETANRAKSAFLANMSHEIRTPLGVVLGFADLLTGPGVTAAERQEYVAAIRRNGDLLSNIINDILDLSKVEAGKIDVEKHLISLSEVLSDLKTMLSIQAQEKGLTFKIESDQGVPAHIVTDPLRLRQILLNIVGNAIKFTSRGGVEVHIKHAIKNNSGVLSFEVRDSGVGISEAQSSRLFEPFTQADASTTRKFGGTGLGLILSKKLANSLGGDVVLDHSVLGEGSTFIITIDPGHPDQKGPEAQKVLGVNSAISRDLSIQANALAGIKVLFVEDAPDNQMIVGRILKNAGAYVDTALNGKDGRDKALHNDYDIVLMDLQMPIMDGYEATSSLRDGGFHTPIIALTAHALMEERQRCLSNGFNDHLSKPINRNALVKCILQHAKTFN